MLTILAVLVGNAVLLAIPARVSFGKALPVSLILSVGLLHFLGMFVSLHVGVVILVVSSVAGYVWLLLSVFRRNDGAPLAWIKAMLNGLLLFLGLYLAVYWANTGRTIPMSDEIYHWAVALKEMVHLDAHYCVPEARNLLAPQYVPGITLFQYLWCKLDGGFSEASAFRALQLLSLSFVLPVVCDMGKKRRGAAAAYLATALVLSLLFYKMRPYLSLMIDAILGILFGYMLARLIAERVRTTWVSYELIAVCFALCLIKESGVFFALSLIAVESVLLAQGRRAGDDLRKWLVPAAGAMVVVLVYVSWKVFLNINHTPVQVRPYKITLTGIMGIFTGDAPAYWDVYF